MAKTASDIGLTPSQIRGARGILGWSITDLAVAARVSISTIQRIEDIQPQPVSDSTRILVRGALEKAGVRFLPDEGEGEGLRLTRPDSKRA
jgi:transcriptional regulator with XRE-family HTH domain